MKDIIKKIIDSLIYFESTFYKNQNISNKKKILILRKDGLGDCILFYPLLSHYRDSFKDCEITLIYPKYFQDLSSLLSKMDKVIWFDHKKFSSNLLYRRKFLINIKKAGYDIAIYPVFSRESIGDFIMKMAGAKEVAGIDGDFSIQGLESQNKGNVIYTKLIKVPKEIKSEFERNIYFAQVFLNKEIIIKFPTIDINDVQISKSELLSKEYNLEKNNFVIVFPGSGANYKIWETDKFAKCMDYIYSKNLIPVLCGGIGEISLGEEIYNKCNIKDKVINLVGKTDLATLCHLINISRFYFGSDTSILHLSVALNIKSIGIIGSGSYERFYPYGDRYNNIAIYDHSSLQLYPVGKWDKSYSKKSKIHPSISAIEVEQAVIEIDKIINL